MRSRMLWPTNDVGWGGQNPLSTMRGRQLDYEDRMRGLAQRQAELDVQLRERDLRNSGNSRRAGEARQRNIQALMAQFQADREAANTANRQRFEEARGLTEANIENLRGQEAQMLTDVDTSARQQGARVGQDLISRGLTGTTIAPTMQAGVERERLASRNRVSADAAQRINAARTDLASLLERRDDVAPGYDVMLSLLGMLNN